MQVAQPRQAPLQLQAVQGWLGLSARLEAGLSQLRTAMVWLLLLLMLRAAAARRAR